MKCLKRNPIVQFFVNWAPECSALLASFAFIYGAAELIFFLTGRRPQDNGQWILDYASKFALCAIVIFLVSQFKQASGTGSWMTKEERFEHPYLATVSDIKVCFSLAVFAYIWLH